MPLDWRQPEHRREAFQRFYSFHLRYRTHPGCVYFALPHIAEALDLDDDQRAWLVWLNGNTQNVVTSLLLLETAPRPEDWRQAVDFWSANFKALEWDTDRRHQKGKFGEATERWFAEFGQGPAEGWYAHAALGGWKACWDYSKSQPYMGRLSAWSMYEYARILLGETVPDIGSWMLEDQSGSQSHRNGIAFVMGYASVYWPKDAADLLGLTPELDRFANDLLAEAVMRNDMHPDVGRLTMESALCTYKSWHKPNRRYPNVYADMFYYRLKRAERFFGDRFQLLWAARRTYLPPQLRLEDNPRDPGLVPTKQNHYLATGQPIMMTLMWPDMANDFEEAVARGDFGLRNE